MTMKAMLSVPVVCLLFSAGPYAVSQTQTANGNFTCISLTGQSFVNPCTGEEVDINNGQVCTATSLTTDGSGGEHFILQFRSRFTATGASTGATYTEHDAASQVANVSGNNLQSMETFTQSYHVNTSGGQNNLYIQEIEHVTTDASGNITALTAAFNMGCH